MRLHGRLQARTRLIERHARRVVWDAHCTRTHLMRLELDQVCLDLFVCQREVVFVDEQDLDKVPCLQQFVTRFFAAHLDVVHPRRQSRQGRLQLHLGA